jgi:acyl-coenzyme A synthetase/AMP-(fatty) acid ligase
MKFAGCRADPARCADNPITDGLSTLRYREIPERLAAIDGVLAEHGVGPTDGVVLGVDNTLPAALTLLALLENGYHVLLLTAAELLEQTDLPVFLRHVLTIDHQADGAGQGLRPGTFLRISGNPCWRPGGTPLSDHEPKLLLRTSGSTGAPKLTVHSHDKLKDNALCCVERFGLCTQDRVAVPAPIYHMYGLGAAWLPSLAAGASIDLQPGANLLKFIQRESRFDPNVAFLTPSFATTLIKTRRSARPYRLTVAAGDRFRADAFAAYEAAFGPLVQLYGSTEQGAVAAAIAGLPFEVRQLSAGLPMPDVQLRLAPAPANEANGEADGDGELQIRRDCGFTGYLDTVGDRIVSDCDFDAGWFRTKDMARLLPGGYLELLGRADHCINRDGVLVAFTDVERVIESLANLDAVAVTTGPGETDRGRTLIAHCVVARGSALGADAIRGHCLSHLPRRSVPDRIRLHDALPLLPNGKVDRVRLQASR